MAYDYWIHDRSCEKVLKAPALMQIKKSWLLTYAFMAHKKYQLTNMTA